MGLKNEFPDELKLMHGQLSAAQLPSGGIAHFYEVDPSNGMILPCPDATGEANSYLHACQNRGPAVKQILSFVLVTSLMKVRMSRNGSNRS